ncbi:MAG: ATP-binding cassette domain-containing protein, partial [Gemmatimonadales bacterium]
VFLGEIRGLDRAKAKKRGAEWLERVGLTQWADKKVEELSKGMQQKVQFIGTVIHEPEILILDEPFSGLDPVNARALKDLFLEMRDQGR